MNKQTLVEIEKIIHRISFTNEFHEEELQRKLDFILSSPSDLPNYEYNTVKRLLFMITGIMKSSNFGYYYYETLQENPFPFCEEILKSSVYNESYYNLNDKALKSYIRSYLLNANIDSKIIMTYDKVIPEGHGIHFNLAFQKIGITDHSLNHTAKPSLYDVLFAVFNKDNFAMTQKKATVIISFLNLKELLPVLIWKARQILNDKYPSSEQILVLIHLFKSISILQMKSLPDELNQKVQQTFNCKCNGELPSFFFPIKNHFTQYIESLQESELLV